MSTGNSYWWSITLSPPVRKGPDPGLALWHFSRIFYFKKCPMGFCSLCDDKIPEMKILWRNPHLPAGSTGWALSENRSKTDRWSDGVGESCFVSLGPNSGLQVRIFIRLNRNIRFRGKWNLLQGKWNALGLMDWLLSQPKCAADRGRLLEHYL